MRSSRKFQHEVYCFYRCKLSIKINDMSQTGHGTSVSELHPLYFKIKPVLLLFLLAFSFIINVSLSLQCLIVHNIFTTIYAKSIISNFVIFLALVFNTIAFTLGFLETFRTRISVCAEAVQKRERCGSGVKMS